MERLQQRLEQRGLSVFKMSLTVVCVLFGMLSFIVLLCTNSTANLSHCLAEMFLVCLPAVVGVLMQFRMNTLVYVFLHFYAISPLLGEMYHLYHIFSWWDDFLHITGGVVFTCFGIFLFRHLNGHRMNSLKFCALFALCFSMTLSTVWELYEFGCDRIFKTDMQKDTVVTSIDSYFLGNERGEIGSLESIEAVNVDGVDLKVDGYIDIGLIDTMRDLLCAFIGSLLLSAGFLIDGDRHPVFVPIRKDTRMERENELV